MYCPHCGRENPNNAMHCAGCAQSLHSDSEPNPFQVSTEVLNTERQQNYLVPAILTTLFCCMPFGIVAIVYAAQVNSHVALRDYAGARAIAAKARTWCWVAFACGVVPMTLYAIAGVLGAFANGGHQIR